MSSTVARLYRYPVKGLNAEPLTSAELRPGGGIPFDRVFAIALAATSYDAARPQWQSKQHFVTLVQHERLAALDARFDERSGVLAVHRNGKPVARGVIGTPIGRAMIEEFLRAYLKNEMAGPPRLVGSATGPMLSDHAEPGLSLIGLATITDIGRVVGQPIDPLRFRANVYVDGTAAWAEFGWVGQEIVLGGARLRVTERLGRCAATNVEPGTGARDMTIPQTLEQAFGHADCGIFATITLGGNVAVGDRAGPIET